MGQINLDALMMVLTHVTLLTTSSIVESASVTRLDGPFSTRMLVWNATASITLMISTIFLADAYQYLIF